MQRTLPALSAFALLSVLAAIAVPAAAAPALPEKPPIRASFLLPGDYHGDEAPTHAGAGWLALAPAGKRWELFAADASSTRIVDEIIDGPGQRSGIRIASSRPDTLALLRFAYLKAGPVETAAIKITEDGIPIEPGKAIAIDFKGAAYRIEVVRKQAYLVKDGARTPLKDLTVNPEGEDGGRLSWAGDLDGDGELDLLVSYFTSNGGGACLYLSSQKAAGMLVKQVGCHGGVGC